MSRSKYAIRAAVFVVCLFIMSDISLACVQFPIPYMYPNSTYFYYLIRLGAGQYGCFWDSGSYDPDGYIDDWLWECDDNYDF
jgi:hypothetical protein